MSRRAATSEGCRERRVDVSGSPHEGRLLGFHIFRVAALGVEAQASTLLAHVRAAALALTTAAAGLLKSHHDKVPNLDSTYAPRRPCDTTCDLVSGDKGLPNAPLVLIQKMKIRATHTRREDLHEGLSRSRLGHGQIRGLNRPVGFETYGPHGPAKGGQAQNACSR